jgi:hypothetical protein
MGPAFALAELRNGEYDFRRPNQPSTEVNGILNI